MTLPYRPRLAAHGLLRHHRVAGRGSLFVIHDTRSHEMIEIEEDQLVALLACDGTRDLGGVFLATAREGAYRRASAIEALLHELARRGLLEDGIVPQFVATSEARPLEPLPGYRLRCEGHGTCCKSFGSIAFTESEAARALRAVPEVAELERVFLPLQGSTFDGACAVALRDAQCTFLGKDGRCEIHRQKPLGCRLYPRSFVDDGETVRVSIKLECPCVFTSLDHADGEPLCGSELPSGTHVPSLDSDGAAIRRWSQEVLALLPDRGDGFSMLWSLAQSVEDRDGVSLDGEPRWSELPPLFEALARRTNARAQSAAGWRAPSDGVRQLAEWLDRAARALAGGERFREPHSERDEAFYVRAIIHGHQAALMDQPLASALRDLSVRVLLARAAAAHASDDDPMARHPLSAVETMMRAQGLGGWLAQET